MKGDGLPSASTIGYVEARMIVSEIPGYREICKVRGTTSNNRP